MTHEQGNSALTTVTGNSADIELSVKATSSYTSASLLVVTLIQLLEEVIDPSPN